MTEYEKLEMRLENTERALHALWSLLEDVQPPAYQDDVRAMLSDYYEANNNLGSKVSDDVIFKGL